MNITREETGSLTATIKVELGSEDYARDVEKTLKEHQKNAVIHGFRPGKVPFGMIKKLYGKSVLLDQINQLLSENLNKYLQEEELKIIGNPIPSREKSPEMDLDHQTSFDFYFDIGLMPEFDLKLDERSTVEYYDISASDKMVDDSIHNWQHRFGEHHHDGDENEHEHQEGEEHQHEPAELNEDFFNKVFPGEGIKDLKTFRERTRKAIENSLVPESERYFMNTVIEKLVKDIAIELPEKFLRKWLKEGGDKELTDEQVEGQYENFSKSLRWQLIESKIARDHEIKVEEVEMRDFVKQYFAGRVVLSAEDSQANEHLDSLATSVLSNQEEAKRIQEELFDKKMLEFFKNKFKLKHKKLEYDDFVKKVTDKKEK